MKRFALLLPLAALTTQSLLAQSHVVKGRVVAEDGNEPLIGVTVRQEGKPGGVVTDANGNYTMQVNSSGNTTLVFSYVGMQTQQKTVAPGTGVVNVTLQSAAKQMDEVVVVAYGTRKKGTIAGSVATINSQKIADVPAAGFDQALQGKATGLTVMANSGEPSKAATFLIRGVNSINSGTAPLFILDGVPISSNDFNTISPNDIQSVSVLKDASATSIYGARAANGVVVITTKKGRMSDRAQVTFRAQYGFSWLAGDKWNLMDTPERIQYEKEVGLSAGQDYKVLSRTNVNWLNAVYNNAAPLQSYELSVSGANDRTHYFISGGYYDQDGITNGSTFGRYNLRFNADYKMKPWLTMGTNTMMAYENIQQAQEGSLTLNTPIFAAQFMLPYWNPYKKDGSYASTSDGTWAGTGVNPLEWMDNNPVKYNKYKVMSSVFAELSLMKGLKFKSQFAVDFSHTTAFMQSFPSFSTNQGQGAAGRSSSDVRQLTVTNTLDYVFDLQNRHNFHFMLGQEGVDYYSEGFSVTAAGQTNDLLTTVSSGTRATAWSDNTSGYAYLSLFGRGEYNYKNKYYADFSLRTDASSRFGKDGRWAQFWSVGLMWDLRKEDFAKGLEWLTNAQVAFSTGTSGNSSIPNYDHLALITSSGFDYNGDAGLGLLQKGNEKLSWESTWSTNLALHLGFWNRLNMDLEFYNKRTTNMLMQVPESYSDGGFGARWDNVGTMVNRGVELSANADVIRTPDFTWNVNANVSYNKNELKKLYNGVDEYTLSETGFRLVVGHDTREFYFVRYAGVNPANGDALWYTKDGQITNVYNEGDKVMTGKSAIAPWQGGFGTTLTYKGISLNAQFTWVGDRYMYNNDRFYQESNGLYTAYNQSKKLLYDRWKKPGDVTEIPRHGVTPELDDRFLENASFLRLKNVSLSYSLPQAWMKKTKFLTAARIYAQGQNLLTFTKFSGLDPESTSNVYVAQYPASRQFTFGLDITF